MTPQERQALYRFRQATKSTKDSMLILEATFVRLKNILELTIPKIRCKVGGEK